MLREALSLWRGRPLADLEHEPFAQEPIRELDELWLEAVELRIDADLATGRHADLVRELSALARRHPLREHIRRQLMLALYRSGRQAEALEAYADLRRTLVDERGLEPSRESRALQEAMLRQDPELDLRRPGALRVVPRRRRAHARARGRPRRARVGGAVRPARLRRGDAGASARGRARRRRGAGLRRACERGSPSAPRRAPSPSARVASGC